MEKVLAAIEMLRDAWKEKTEEADGMYQKTITGIFLAICTGTDIKRRRVYKSAAAAYFILAAAGHTVSCVHAAVSEDSALLPGILVGILCGLVPGAFCFLVSWGSRQALGYGDSLLISICGISLGFLPCVWIILTAFFCSGLWAAILFLFRKAGRKQEFPFVPFLLLGYVLQIMESG